MPRTIRLDTRPVSDGGRSCYFKDETEKAVDDGPNTIETRGKRYQNRSAESKSRRPGARPLLSRYNDIPVETDCVEVGAPWPVWPLTRGGSGLNNRFNEGVEA